MQEKDSREIRGIAIISKGDSPETLGEGVYLVPSQSSTIKYRVEQRNTFWSCECPDFKKRKISCKHIHSILFWLKTKETIQAKTFTATTELPIKSCVYCQSSKIVKNGLRKTQVGNRQKYQCKMCKRSFVLDLVKKIKGNSKMVTLVLDLYFKGISLRKIQDHLNQFYGFGVSYVTIYRWIARFTKLIDTYTETLEPKTSGRVHVDEQFIKAKGKQVYCWNALDSDTRFLLASNVTKTRSVKDARKIIRKFKDTEPREIITDGLYSYGRAIKKEMPFWKYPYTQHKRYATIRDKRLNNNRVERYHSSFRERDKVVRGFKTINTPMISGYRNYYNFVRNHSTLGMTPSAKAGIINFEGNRWMGLLELSVKNVPENVKGNFKLRMFDSKGNDLTESKKRMFKTEFTSLKKALKFKKFYEEITDLNFKIES